MSDFSVFRGDGRRRRWRLPEPPPWRRIGEAAELDRAAQRPYLAPVGLADAVNAALALRRPLLLVGSAGSGKSSAIEAVADELDLGAPLRWNITSRTTVQEALYRYDALGRIHAQQLMDTTDDIGRYIQLGPLGTALLPQDLPCPLLIDELDKADIDIVSDLLAIFERGSFEIVELARLEATEVTVRTARGGRVTLLRGQVRCQEFPFVVMTSNGERDFPPAFLRRCVRFDMPMPDGEMLSRIVAAHLGAAASERPDVRALMTDFLSRVSAGQRLAVDQVLNAAFLLQGTMIEDADRDELLRLLTRELDGG